MNPEWILLACVAVAIGLALRSQRFIARLLVVGILISLAGMFVMYLEFAPRSVVAQRAAAESWTQDYRDGAVEAVSAIRSYLPHLIVGIVGLALLALKPMTREKRAERDVTDD